MEIKAEARELRYQKEKDELFKNELTIEDVHRAYEASNVKKMEKRVRNYVDILTAEMDRQMLEDTIKDWENDPIKKQYVRILKSKRKSIK